ncbi:hypothetical protein CHUAL_003308 [Chamberlinius hualienensis]
MVSYYNRTNKTIKHISVNACLAPVCSVHGMAVTTVEGIGSTKTRLHPVQERLAKAHGSQCGFCTPGIVMSMYALLRNKVQPSVEDLEVAFQGNLCRCTGYRPILQGFLSFTKDANGSKDTIGENAVNEGCCQGKVNGNCCKSIAEGYAENGETNGFIPYDPSQEPIFPPELQLLDVYDNQYLLFEKENIKWIRPTTLKELVDLKSNHPEAKLVVGNTEVGVEVKFKKCRYPILVSPTAIEELKEINVTTNGLHLGAAVTLSQLYEACQDLIASESEYKTRIFHAISEMLNLFAGKQIRNVGCLAGNIMTASPISDLNPIFLAANCIVTAVSKDGQRQIPMDQNFFVGYRKTAVKSEEILQSIFIPFTAKNEYFYAYKQSKRREDDIAIVNAAYKVSFTNDMKVQTISMAYGGMAPITVMLKKTPSQLIGRKWDNELLETVCQFLEEELPLQPHAPGSMIAFRRSLTTSFFYKFYLSITKQLEILNDVVTSQIPKQHESALKQSFKLGSIKGSQYYQLPPEGQMKEDSVGRPIVHLSAFKQATGEAVYCDDIPSYENELHLALVTSSRAHARIVSINLEKALQRPGVVTFMCHQDVANNTSGPIFQDEEVFASKKVTCQGQVIGAIVAIDKKTAQLAAQEVVVVYEDIQPVVISIEDAIKHQTFAGHEIMVKYGEPQASMALSAHCLEGEMRVGAQEHFYLETNCAIAIPKNEDGEIEVICGSQGLTGIQMQISKALGVPANRIVCKTKRLGGGFGGKESRNWIIAIPCAIAAQKLGRPVRCMLDRDEDMAITGTRHPFLGRYKAGFTDEGKIVAVNVQVYSNIGNSMDLSLAVMERCLLSIENGYYFPNVHVKGKMCLTNLPSNTAFRGFGGPQGMIIAESIMDDVALTLGKDPAEVRELNLVQEGQQTPYKQVVEHCTMKRCWDECSKMSNYWGRRKDVEEWNRNNRWRKRGLAIIPTKFAVSFDIKFLNQAGALVHVYRDGSVLISHSGVEMGQGLHTKMIQVASRALGIPTSKIHISETSTDKVPNTSATAASVGSDLNGMAIIDACNKIKHRLEPVITANPKGTWEQWITKAYLETISLSAAGYYAVNDISGFNFEKQTGKPFLYFSFGVACSEVEIDCLTGDHHVNIKFKLFTYLVFIVFSQILRTDIVMDVGESLNPTIDVGQIEGAFIQGYGLFTMEEHRYSPDGFLFTRGPGMYKIPSFSDVPNEFNVALLKGSPNIRAVYSSKAVGEPPLFLSAAVYFAIKDAIKSARSEEGLHGRFQLLCPATAERIRMACVDRFTQQFPPADPSTYKPWSIDHL